MSKVRNCQNESLKLNELQVALKSEEDVTTISLM